jgi:DNA-binding NtrC family response regulator
MDESSGRSTSVRKNPGDRLSSGPKPTPGRVLVVDDEPSMCQLIETILKLRGHEVTWCQSASRAIEWIKEHNFDVVVTDVRMPGTDGLTLCRQIGDHRPELPVVVMTAFGSVETAIEALRSGAYDFVIKPFENDVMVAAVTRAVESSRLKQQVRVLKQQQTNVDDWPLLGTSEPMKRVTQQLLPIAASEASVLINGESGTGKELVARTIHAKSSRSSGPFVAINCAALSESLLESELFGHVRGAFTDARADRDGLFVTAKGGTLLLDEMGDMPMSLQVKLLRVLEENSVRPVGSNHEIPLDVRVLSATHRDLESAVEEGTFRGDLYYRINVINVDLPPLRSRGSDILLIAQHFVDFYATKSGRQVSGITRPAAAKLLAYRWPGNIRELRNVIERGVALSTTDQIGLEDLPEKIVSHDPKRFSIDGDDPDELVPLEQIERQYIDHVLQMTDQNKTRAAEILGLDRKTLYRKLKES